VVQLSLANTVIERSQGRGNAPPHGKGNTAHVRTRRWRVPTQINFLLGNISRATAIEPANRRVQRRYICRDGATPRPHGEATLPAQGHAGGVALHNSIFYWETSRSAAAIEPDNRRVQRRYICRDGAAPRPHGEAALPAQGHAGGVSLHNGCSVCRAEARSMLQ
jgi:hypothetical protein